MAVNINDDNSLSWIANIDTDTSFQKDVDDVIKGHRRITAAAEKSSLEQQAAFEKVKAAMQAAGQDTSQLEKTYNGFVQTKNAVTDLALELNKLKSPDYLTGKTADGIAKANQYIEQQEKLFSQLQSQLTDYANELTKLSEIPIKQPELATPKAAPSQTVSNVSSVIGDQVLEELKKQFTSIDPVTQKFISDIIDLEVKLHNLNITQKNVADAFNAGTITENEYKESQEFLVAGIQGVNDEVVKLTENHKQYEASLKQNTGSIAEKKSELDKLKQVYEDLSEAERNSAKGKDLDKQIKNLKVSIDSLDPTKIDRSKESVVTLRTELNNLIQQMAREPNSPLFAKWQKEAAELTETIKTTREGIEQATNTTAGIEAFASGLRGILGGFEAGVGIIGLFTDDTEKYEKVTKDAAAALALMNGVQEISNVLQKSSALNIYLNNLLRKENAVSIVAETVATETQTAAAVANTVATEASTAATVTATAASRGFFAAMLANPAGLIVAAVAAIAAAYLVLSNHENEAVTKANLLKEAEKKVNNTLDEKRAKLEPLVALVKEGNLTEAESLDIHKQLKEIDEGLIKGLDAKSLSYSQLAINVKAYTDSLRTQYKIEANKEALQASFAKEAELQKKLDAAQTSLDKAKKGQAAISAAPASSGAGQGMAGLTMAVSSYSSEVIELTENLNKQKEVSESLVTDNAELIKSTVKVGDAEHKLAELKRKLSEAEKEQATKTDNSVDFQKFQKNIDSLKAQIKAIEGPSKSDIKKQQTDLNKAQREYNKLLEEQKKLNEDIAAVKRDAFQSGLVKELSQVDKINEKYDLLKNKVQDFNSKVAAKNPNLVIATDPIEVARRTELQNEQYRTDAENFKKIIDQKKDYFTDFEDFKLQYGEEKAKALFSKETNGATSYLEYLKGQRDLIEQTSLVGPKQQLDNGQLLKLQALNKAIQTEEDNEKVKAYNKTIENYKKLLEATKTYKEQELEINKKYDELFATLNGDNSQTQQEKDKKTKLLEAAKKEELQQAKDTVAHESQLYKTLNADLITYTRKMLEERLRLLKKYLKDGQIVEKDGSVTKLTPQMKKDLEEAIKTSTQGVEDLNEVFGLSIEKLETIQKDLDRVGGILGDLSGIAEDFDAGLADSLSTMQEMVSVGSSLVGALASFASGDIIGGIANTVKAITGIFSIGKKARESERKANEAVAKFNLGVLLGEVAVNELYRARAREQVRLNQLKLKGIAEESRLLKEQQAANVKDYQTVYDLIQKQNKIVSEGTAKYGGFLGIGRKTKVTQQFESLQGKSFDELQTLFISGQLDDKAKELFQQLEKIKSEGVDIDKMLEQNRLEAQQIFTGTTSDSILDSIVEGFANGKRATEDFADDFKKLMQKAVLQSLKYQALEAPLKKFYDDFAAATQSDNVLTADEISRLQAYYNQTITAASEQFDKLKKITNLDFNDANQSQGNNLAGSIKGITQQQADLLAGQFGGLRLTAFDQLQELKNVNNVLKQIELNTSLIEGVFNLLSYMKVNGIKLI